MMFRTRLLALLPLVGATAFAFHGAAAPDVSSPAAVAVEGPDAAHVTLRACTTSWTEVSPCTGSVSAQTNQSGLTRTFSIKNKQLFSRTFGLTCIRTGVVSSCSVASTVTIGSNATRNVTVTYATGSVAGTGTLQLDVNEDDEVSASATVTTTNPSPTYTVSVTPDAQAVTAAASAVNSHVFRITNSGTGNATYSLTATCPVGFTNCSAPASQYVAAGLFADVTATFEPPSSGSTGTVTLAASYSTASDNGSINATADAYTVTVNASNDTAWVSASAADTLQFTIRNLGSSGGTYNLVPACSGSVSSCVASPSTLTLAADGWATGRVAFQGGTLGTTGRVALTASLAQASGVRDSTEVTVIADYPCETQYTVIRNCSPLRTNPASTGQLSELLFLENWINNEPSSYTLSCTVEGVVNWCSFDPDTTKTSTSTGAVPANGGQDTVRVYYSTAGTLSTGRVRIVADGNLDIVSMRVHVAVTYNTPTPARIVGMTPTYQELTAPPGTSHARDYIITNHGDQAETIVYQRTCAGAGIASGCTPATDSAIVQAGASHTATVSFVTGSTSTTGTTRLTAWLSGASAVRDSGMIDVTVAAPVAGLVLATPAPGTSLARDLCVTIAAGSAAAAECGELRVAHTLPATRTMGLSRVPTLLYTSGHAHPHIIVGADLTRPADGKTLASVRGTLKVNGVPRDSAIWSASDFPELRTRRIALGYDALNDLTGIYPFTVEARREYTDGSSVTDPIAGEVVVVNRASSPFGSGWWLAGLEQLLALGDATFLWIGGDGSTRRYVGAGANRWSAAAVDRPDTLSWNGTHYVRLLPNGLRVVFNAAGEHVYTITRHADTTAFTYLSSRLATIALPPTGSGKSYAFAYDGAGKLDYVTAPANGVESRVVGATVNGSGDLATLIDPDATTVSFGYDATAAHRLTTRTDRRNTVTRYVYGDGGLLRTATIELDLGQTIVTTIESQATRGWRGASATEPEKSYTRVDGPRTDVGDSTLFWLDRFGAPRKIRDALGNETLLARGDSRWPALVTRVRNATGQIMAAGYDDRGRVIASTDSSRYDPARAKYATTLYEWTTAPWDLLTKVTRPEGEVALFGYDTTGAAATGNRLWEQPGTDPSRRVEYSYGSALGLLSSTLVPGATRDSVHYDALGNLEFVQSPRGPTFRAYTRTDAIGRDTLVVTPIDTAGTFTLQERIWYDLADQDTLRRIATPAMSQSLGAQGSAYSNADTLFVRQEFDDEGNLSRHEQWARPDENTIGVLVRRWDYDRANRKTMEHAPVPAGTTWDDEERFQYDPAGNVTEWVTRVNETVRTSYDALGRPVRRTMPAQGLSLPGFTWGGSFPADTARLGYDAAGRLLWANNLVARVTRRYDRAGQLAADTLRVRFRDTSVAHFAGHVYGLRFMYDLNGRRTGLAYPAGLMPAGKDSVRYAYEPVFGAAGSVTDWYGHGYDFRYDDAGRLDTLQLPGGITESRSYFADGALRARIEGSSTRALHNDLLTYDARGKLLNAHVLIPDYGGQIDDFPARYDGMGALIYAKTFAELPVTEKYVLDAMGNVDTVTRSGGSVGGGVKQSTHTYKAGTGRLDRSESSSGVPGLINWTTRDWDAAGQLSTESRHRWVQIQNGSQQVVRDSSRYWYGPDGKLLAVELVHDSAGLFVEAYREHEEYWYDALGRRVWARMHRGTGCTLWVKETGCRSTIARTVWDGADLLLEIRAPATTPESDGGGGPHYGRVVYLNGGVIDRPLALLRMGDNTDVILPHRNYRGLADAGTCLLGVINCAAIEWPAKTYTAYMDSQDVPSDSGPVSWYGSVILEQKDGSGLLYRRNRYVDPATGRFTQEDPIGLAGGLNLYGYAGGDPVNFSDPFGLCPNPMARGLGSLQCAMQDILGAIKAGPGMLARAITTPSDKRDFVVGLAMVPFTVAGGGRKAGLTAAEAATAKLAAELTFTGTTAGHMAQAGRWVPRHLLAEAIQGGKRMADPQGAEGAVKIVQSMFRNGKEYTLDIIYREKDKMILHFQYAPK